jgi:hypothetical protein
MMLKTILAIFFLLAVAVTANSVVVDEVEETQALPIEEQLEEHVEDQDERELKRVHYV